VNLLGLIDLFSRDIDLYEVGVVYFVVLSV
jgi:hypothetical protein